MGAYCLECIRKTPKKPNRDYVGGGEEAFYSARTRSSLLRGRGRQRDHEAGPHEGKRRTTLQEELIACFP